MQASPLLGNYVCFPPFWFIALWACLSLFFTFCVEDIPGNTRQFISKINHNCRDFKGVLSRCHVWKDMGFCFKYRRQMQHVCNRTCQYCSEYSFVTLSLMSNCFSIGWLVTDATMESGVKLGNGNDLTNNFNGWSLCHSSTKRLKHALLCLLNLFISLFADLFI